MITGQKGRPAPTRDIRNVLDLPPDQVADAVAASGAMNAAPPVVHSSHLYSKSSGNILPWNALLAEQRDIMIPCDKYGNTDPSAWEPTVVEMDDDAVRDEQERLYWAARASVVHGAMDITGMYEAKLAKGQIPSNDAVPSGTMSLDSYYETAKDLPKDFGPKKGKSKKKSDPEGK